MYIQTENRSNSTSKLSPWRDAGGLSLSIVERVLLFQFNESDNVYPMLMVTWLVETSHKPQIQPGIGLVDVEQVVKRFLDPREHFIEIDDGFFHDFSHFEDF